MDELIDRVVSSVPREKLAVVASRLREASRGLERSIESNARRFFRSPVRSITAMSRAVDEFGSAVSESLQELGDVEIPRDVPEKVANLVETRGPTVLSELLAAVRNKVDELEKDPKGLAWFPFFIRAERRLPFATVQTIDQLLGLALDSASVAYNAIAQWKPPQFDEDADDEERSRRFLEWGSQVVKNIYFPFAVRAVVIVQSVMTGDKKLHAYEDAQAVKEVNASLQKSGHSESPLNRDLVILRHGESHPVGAFEVRADGYAVLKPRAGRLELSPAQCAQIGSHALKETVGITAALGLAATWRIVEAAAVSNVVQVIAAGIRGEELELISAMEPLAKETEAQFIRVGLMEAPAVTA